MDAIIDTLEAALAELEAKAMASSTSFHTTPILLIQPPASRAVHAERLDVFAKRLGVTHGSVSSLCGRLGSIKEKLETVGAQIFRQQCCCTSARSPVSSLPPELLLKVFAVAQSDDPFVVRKIMCVSSRWRQAAMQERSLWRRINIPVDQLSIIQSPTSLTPFIGDPIHAVFTSRAWRSMAPEVGSALLRRLVTANIQGSSGPAVLGAITNCVDDEDASFSALEELQLEMPVDSDSGHVVRGEGPSPLYSYNARAMPCLRTLTLRRCLFEMMEPTSITDLTIASVETQIVHFEDVLTSCHRLVSLRIDDTIVIGELIEQRILLSELRSLEIRREGGPDAGVILAHIAAPALRSFIMHDVQVSETGAHDFEVGEITNEALIFEEVRFLIANSPELETLELPSEKFGLKQFIRMLLPHRDGFLDTESGTCPLPRLSKLDISLLHAFRDPNAASGLIDHTRIMLKKRLEEFGPLKKLTISPCMAIRLHTDGTAEAVVLGDCPFFVPNLPQWRFRPNLEPSEGSSQP